MKHLPLQYLVQEFVNLWINADGNVIMDDSACPRPLVLVQHYGVLSVWDEVLHDEFILTPEYLAAHAWVMEASPFN
jgi:hypothetical protein